MLGQSMGCSSCSDRFDIFQVYRRYSEIRYRNTCHDGNNCYMASDGSEKSKSSKEALGELSKMLDKSLNSRDSVFGDLLRLMSQLNLMGNNFSEFSNFYEFVFFILREKGQKSLPVWRAIAAWKIVLPGRFRLLNQWCDFVEKYQRHNISEDTWSQVLAFSRCVHEDLEGYDPEGAWPVLIDEFVEHMYRITGSSHKCSCGDAELQAFTFAGLKSFPGLKRKLRNDHQRTDIEIPSVLSPDGMDDVLELKRRKYMDELESHGENAHVNLTVKSIETTQVSNNSPFRCSKSPCAVEGCLSKGFEGLFSSRSCTQFDQDHTTSYS